MKKADQIAVNERVIEVYEMTKEERENLWRFPSHQLRSCSAKIYEGNTGYFLKSYATVIAYVPYGFTEVHPAYGNLIYNPCYDFLRYVYCYTATSAQHISKFCADYHAGEKLTFKEV